MSDTDKRFVLEPEAIRILGQYGVAYPEHGLAHTAEEAARIAERIGYPVVLKVVSPDVVHKSDAGGVAVGLENAAAVRQGYEQMLARVQTAVPGAKIEGVLVVQQAAKGLEVIIGALDDMTFGATIMFGLGGIFTEVLKDVTFRVAPLERRDAEEMIKEIKAYPMLTGVRGQAAVDSKALVDLIMGVSRMLSERPDIKELDLNPVRLYPQGALALDVRMLVKG